MLDRLLISSSARAIDPHFRNVTLLLHGDGSNGAQNNTFIDSSSNNFTITRNGNTTQGSFSPYGSNWSNYFDGTGDYLGVTPSALSTGDFTFECWIYATGTGQYQYLYDTRTSTNDAAGFCVIYNHASYPNQISIYSNGFIGTPTINVPANTWTHFALVRSSGSWRTFVNGVADIASTSASRTLSNTALKIGTGQALDYFFNGYLSNYRIVTSAVYTSAFTPSTTPLTAITNTSLLTCAYNRFRDGSTNNFTITRNGDVKVTNFAPFAPSSAYSTTTNGGSAYFDGSGDYLLAPNNTALDVWDSGSGNFTVEAWIYPTVSMPNNCSIVGKAELNGSPGWTAGWAFQSYSNRLNVNTAGDTRLFNSNTTDIPVGAWSHVVLVKSSSTVSIFQNGTRVATITNSSSYSNTSDQVHIGTDRNTAGSKFTGWMAGIRMVKGTAVYDPTQSTLTVPTSPPTAVTNTNLLLNATNAAIFDNSMKNDLETVGNAQISTSVKKFGTGSMAFDGSGDYLLMPLNTQLQLGSGNFTIEFWLNLVSRDTSGACIFANYNSFTTGALSFFAGHATSSSTKYQIACNGTFPAIQSSANVAYNQWDHFAIVRNGNTLTLYINGTADGTFSMTGISVDGVGSNWIVGAALDALTNYELNGYLDEFRITKGVARYTANFTAPTAPFPNK